MRLREITEGLLRILWVAMEIAEHFLGDREV